MGKIEFEPIENSAHTTELLTLGKALLARLYLCLKVYLTLTKNFIPYME